MAPHEYDTSLLRGSKMNITVFDAPKAQSEVCLRLRKGCSNGVELIVVNPNTGNLVEGGLIITFRENGTIFLWKDVNPDIGLKLNDNGNVVIARSFE